jgi:hypothetical protein
MLTLPDIPDEVSLPCKVDAPQQTLEWCWDDTARAFATYVGIDNVPSQGDLANWRTGRKDCTNTPTPQACIVAATNDQIIAAYDFLGVGRVGPDLPLLEETLIEELLDPKKGPIEIEYAWQRSGGHVAIINGYRKEGNILMYSVSDPFYGEGWATYEFLRRGYNQGVWIRTFGRFFKKEKK